MASKLFAQLMSEFVGTYMLVWTVSCVVLGNQSTFNALSLGMVLMIFIYGLGGISGAHFNPAVSMAVLCAGKMEAVLAFQYMAVQLAAGVLAGGVMCVLNANFAGPVGPQLRAPAAVVPAGAVLPGGDRYSAGQALTVEFLYTFMLAFMVLSTACYTKAAGNQYYGLAIGFVICAAGYGGGPISCAALNPAVAIGLGPHPNVWAYAYAAVELVAGAAAALVFMVVRHDDYAPDWKPSILTKLLAESLGTFFLCLTVGLNVYGGGQAIAIAAALMCMVYALGSVSGGHFNPAVTIAVATSGRNILAAGDALLYVAAQLGGGTVGAVVAKVLADPRELGHIGPARGSVDGAGKKIDLLDCADEEFMFTFALAFTVLCVATVRKPLTHMFGFAIGMVVVIGGTATSYSGGALNPAVALGLEVANCLFHSGQPGGCEAAPDGSCFDGNAVCLFFLYECLGGLAASGVFRCTHAEEFIEEAAKLVDKDVAEEA